MNKEPVEYANEDQAFDNSENLAGKMTIPSISLLSLLASCSLYRYVALPTTCYIVPPILPCQASNPPSQQTVVWLYYRFCSAPLIALLVAGEDEVCSMLEHGYVGMLQHSFLLHAKQHRAVNRRFVPSLFCLPFANRASVSGDLYIDFNQNHLIFPAAHLVCQVYAQFILSLPKHAYALHITSRMSCHVLHHVACALHRD